MAQVADDSANPDVSLLRTLNGLAEKAPRGVDKAVEFAGQYGLAALALLLAAWCWWRVARRSQDAPVAVGEAEQEHEQDHARGHPRHGRGEPAAAEGVDHGVGRVRDAREHPDAEYGYRDARADRDGARRLGGDWRPQNRCLEPFQKRPHSAPS